MTIRPIGSFIDAVMPWLRALPYFIVAALAVGLVVTRAKLEAEKANGKALVAMYEARTAEALAADMDHAAEVATAYTKAREEAYHDIDAKLAAARAAADDYVRRMRAQAGQGGGGAPRLPAAPAAAVEPDGPGEATIVPVSDLQICADNTVIATGWQDWWAAVSKPAAN